MLKQYIDALKKLGYVESISWDLGTQLEAREKKIILEKDARYYVDGIFRIPNYGSILIAISSPERVLKGYMIVDKTDFDKLMMSELRDKFDIPIVATEEKNISITHQYGMRKIDLETYDQSPERFELREGFKDFPNCPYGNTYKVLGYDKIEREYVRFSPGILKKRKPNRI